MPVVVVVSVVDVVAVVIGVVASHVVSLLQSVRDMIISGTRITDLQGLENVRSFGNELSIEYNSELTTTRQLGANLPESHLTSIQNIGVRGNRLLEDLEGFSYIREVTGECAATINELNHTQ